MRSYFIGHLVASIAFLAIVAVGTKPDQMHDIAAGMTAMSLLCFVFSKKD